MDHNAENIWDTGLGNGLCQMIAVIDTFGTVLKKGLFMKEIGNKIAGPICKVQTK